MYIVLNTINVWEVRGDFSAAALFDALQWIATQGDIIVIGAYNPCDEAYDWLLKNSIDDPVQPPPYGHSFEANRREFPRGRAFSLPFSAATLSGLKELSLLAWGSVDIAVFFDHLAIYRPGLPVIPLVNFHDAFYGGGLFLSGLYRENELRAFFETMGVRGEYVANPEILALKMGGG